MESQSHPESHAGNSGLVFSDHLDGSSAPAAPTRHLATPSGGMVSQEPDQLFRRAGLCTSASVESEFLHVEPKNRQPKIQKGMAESLGRFVVSPSLEWIKSSLSVECRVLRARTEPSFRNIQSSPKIPCRYRPVGPPLFSSLKQFLWRR